MPRFNQDGMRVLNVAEKNDAAKCLSQIMSNGNSNRREGFSKYNKLYEFNYQILGCNCYMVMTSVSGHLIDLDFAGGYKNWQNCQPLALFDAPIARFVSENFQPIKRTLQREVKNCQALIIWTDGDREGENIGFEIIEVCKEVKPSIRLYRARFSEITPRAVNIACQNLAEPNENVSNAVEVRRELDLRIGAAFTRLQTLRLTKRFPDVLNGKLISYGSCQFPTLGFVVERYKQVEEFISEIFYKIKVFHAKDNCNVEFSWQRGRLFNERVCQMFCNMCQQNPQARVTKVISKPKSKWRPVPLDTVELEKLGSRKLRINAKETMKIAEKLYTQGFISYPRTETNIFPKGMDLVNLVQDQTIDQRWGEFANGVLQNGGPNPRQGKKTDNAHPPIHPTKYTSTLQGNEHRIYELIVRHFLACVSKDAQGQETIVEINIANEKFSAQGLMILERNYLDVYVYENWNAKAIAIYQQGYVFTPDKIEMVTGETRAPPLLSEAELITLMEKHGIGTDATHAEHIETIKARDYVGVQNDGTFLPGQLGMGLVEGYDAMGFAMSKPYLRSALEADLKCICDGSKRREDVLQQQITSYRNVFVQAAEQVDKLDNALSEYLGQPQNLPESADPLASISEPIRKCPKCGQDDMILRKTKENSWMLGCMSFPNCRNSIFFPKFVLSVSKSQATCPLCEPRPVSKLDFEFKKGSVPPMMGTRYTGCVGGCDEMLTGVLDARISSSNSTNTTNLQRAGTTRPELNGNRGNQLTLVNRESQQTQGRSSQYNRGRDRGRNIRGAHRGRGRSVGFSDDDNNWGRKDTNDINENAVMCMCNQAAAKFTVKKEGPNNGRQFYSCSNNNTCSFFLWADADGQGTTSRSNSGFQPPQSQNQRQSTVTDNDGEVLCQCEQPAAVRTVNKEGANKGRQFYGCSKPRDESCQFFQWFDGPPMSNISSRGAGNGGGSRGTNMRGVGRGGPPRKRKCGGCGQEGHTKRSCPFGK